MGTELRDLGRAISARARGARDPQLIAPGVKLFSSPTVTTRIGTIAEPNLALVAQGAKRSLLGSETFDYGAGQFLIITADVPLTSWITQATADEPFLAVGLSLEPLIVAELLLERPTRRSSGAVRTVDRFDASAELIDAVLRLVRLVDAPDDFRVLHRSLVREIHWRLLTGPSGQILEQIGKTDGELVAIARATAWLRDHSDRPFRAEELASAAGLSVSSLNRYFRRVMHVSPLQYQKQLRLQEARLHLFSGARGVAEAGYAVGYASASQFAREYRRYFGSAPHEDRERRPLQS